MRDNFFMTRQAPFRLAGFLEYTTRLIFTQKVGGGYIFVHRLLREYL